MEDQKCANAVSQTQFPSLKPFVIKLTMYNAETQFVFLALINREAMGTRSKYSLDKEIKVLAT